MRSGVILILLSMSLTPLGDGLSKHLGETQSPFLIVFLRYLTAGVLAWLVARATGTRVELPRADRNGMLVRSFLVIGAMTLLIMALACVSLASAVGGFLVAPIAAMLISVLWFGERLTISRLVGALISFGGALLILRPGAGFEPGILLALAGGLMLGGFLALTRATRCALHPVSVLAIQCLLGSVLLLPFAVPHFGDFRAELLVPVLGLGLVTAATHFLTVAAYQRADSAQLAPFFYFNLVAAIFVGVIWFGELPGPVVALGLLCIVAGGLISLISPAFVKAALAEFQAWRTRKFETGPNSARRNLVGNG